MRWSHRSTLLLVLGAVACGHPRALPPDAAHALRQAGQSSDEGTLVYEGTVSRRETEGASLFRYERRVQELDAGSRSSHVTFSPRGEPIVSHQADHSPSYALRGFREIHAQTGLVGEVVVGPDGTATFQSTVNGRTRSRTEAPGDPLHVGPTLFGHVLENWDALMAEPLTVRFAVLERRRSFRFRIERVDGPAGTTTFEMVPTHLLLKWVLPSNEMVFDTNRNVVRYSGWVPPLEEVGDRRKRLDATVTYERVSDVYR